ncbi:MAG: hypothetical protein WCV70_00505 [Patescibacteria group bacterium]|jgi:hypothetical protein
MKKTARTKKRVNSKKRVNLGKYIISLAVFALVISGFYWFFNRDYRDPRVLGAMEKLLPSISKNIPEIYTQAVEVSFGDKTLGLQPLAGEPVKVKRQDVRSIYEEAYKNTDVIQTEYPYKLKEELVFSAPGHPLIFKYNIKNYQDFIIEIDREGNVIFYDKENYNTGKDLAKVFTIPTPFIEDKVGQRSFSAVTTTVAGGLLTIAIDENWLVKAKYPITLDPTVEINILNLYSHPQQGDNWEVEFTTKGTADLKIIPEDQATIDDDEFISLSCNGETRIPQILAGDIIYYPNWQCLPRQSGAPAGAGVGKVVHRTLKAGKHTLRFEFGDSAKPEELITVWAYNDPGDPWYNSAWGYRIKITALNAKVDADLENFPVYVNLDDLPDATFWAHVKTACADVRITKTDGTAELPREIVSCDTSAKTGEMHFKADALADSTDTDFYIYYGNADATEPVANAVYGPQNVWTNSYQAVYHLQQDPSGNGADAIKDSTANAYHATPSGSPVNGAGKLTGNGVVFGGDNDQLIDADQLWPNANNNITISMWNNEASADGGQNSSIVWYTNSGNERIGAHAPWSNVTYWDFGTCCTDSRISGDYTPYDDKYSLLHYVSNGSANKIIYIDGVSRYSNMSAADNPGVDLVGLGIGSGINQMWHKGTVDEVRIATTTRASTWISTEYNNQNSPATFYGLDTEEAAPATETPAAAVNPQGINIQTDTVFKANMIFKTGEPVE